jgi:hypothetical protein
MDSKLKEKKKGRKIQKPTLHNLIRSKRKLEPA